MSLSIRYRVVSALLAVLLAGCSTLPMQTLDNAKSQASRVQFLVLHYTVENEADSLRILTQQAVSSHYLVGGPPHFTVYRLVPEDRLATHAGPSEWQGANRLNATSIGIEIVNRGWWDTPEGRQWEPYPPEQVEKIVALVKDIVQRHQIRPDRVIGHSDIAPGRKQDPGVLFPWKRLADEGLVRWPDAARAAQLKPGFETQLPDAAWFQAKLAEVGYKVPRDGQLNQDTRDVIQAFQMKYRPAKYDGEPDAETAALLAALTPAP